MSDSVNKARVNRRDLLLGAVFLVGGAAALTRFAGTPRETGLGSPARLGSDRFALLEQVSETIIPATDTPGAIAAGAPQLLRELLEQWATDATRERLLGVLDAIERSSWTKFGAAFVELSPERRLDVMRAFDTDAYARHDGNYGHLKYLVLLCYYQSEIGATQELRFELVPGAWRSCVPLNEIGRASAV